MDFLFPEMVYQNAFSVSFIAATGCYNTFPDLFQSRPYLQALSGKYLHQGCGNTMPDLSDLVPFHSGQVKNFYLLVLGHV